MRTSRTHSFLPKSILALRKYSVRKFLADLVAGLTVGLVSQPLVVMANSGFIGRLEEGNVCPDIAAALARACEILGLPPVAELPEPHEALHTERQTVESVRRELTEALDRAQNILKTLDRASEEGLGNKT